jgi:hypothetical protein
MSDTALAAAYRAIQTRLTANTNNPVWNERAYPDLAPASAARPFAVFFWSGGGEANRRRVQDADLLITIKVVADSLAEAFAGAERLSALLNDADAGSALALDGGASWDIVSVTQERAVHLVEMVDAQQVYHAGAVFRVRMEAK